MDYQHDTSLLSYDLTGMTTFIDRALKSHKIDGGVSIPVTQYYIM